MLPRHPDSRVDLHLHTNRSDGAYTPAQIVDLARRAGLPALALTDHDTTDGIAEARAAAADLEIVPGVEITTEFQGREFHLLAYYFRPDDLPLLGALSTLRQRRAERFREMVDRLRPLGVTVDSAAVDAALAHPVVGRRQLAELLVETRQVSTVRQAFSRYLGDSGGIAIPPVRLPVANAVALVRKAGGVAAVAHPAYDCTRETLATLAALGVHAVEVEYPSFRPSRSGELRGWAAELGLATTGGSDCHGPDDHHRAVGARGVSVAELDRLRSLATS
jgi:predicted metal-dependent phosphoesterase TrpH